jgi:hypothetical protein
MINAVRKGFLDGAMKMMSTTAGVWHNIDSGDGWGFYDGNQDSLWNDVIQMIVRRRGA